ncbi:GIY-YIG nuclease family protein [Rhodococcus sp. Z13]|uniref:GIY-YIG nuclease family protein n=1 Tax=Rhodococcus sacchari TaxID=2962047 RepID=A0ACD4DCD4_9NOCA|nr:GIY-YIG nuclease family protein [Rhodococcus sp. Z13]UYP17745.1 GIY-YIG nuclease family protein [Rhodococcus sp. Z13]
MTTTHYTSNGVKLWELPEVRRANGSGFDGYLYIIEFSTGTMKVGRTNNPRGRIRTHWEHARKFGADITRLWLSVPHTGYRDNETSLLRELGTPSAGTEYFTSKNFDDVVALAESSLHFHVLTEKERQELEEESKRRGEARIEALRRWGGIPDDAVRIVLDPDINEWVANMVFGRYRKLPEFAPDRDLFESGEVLEALSTATGLDIAELAEWSFMDVIEFMGQQQLRIGVANLTVLAYESGRDDLVKPGFYRGVIAGADS